jgi:hypothetical protein
VGGDHQHRPRAVKLDGWTLQDEDGHTYTFDHIRLEGRTTVRIHTGVGRDRSTDLYQDRRHYVWDNQGEPLVSAKDAAPQPAPQFAGGALRTSAYNSRATW